MHVTKRTIHVSLIAGTLALSACGDSTGGSDPNAANATTINGNNVGVNSAPSSDELRSLLAQGLINDEAINLSDNANRQTDDRQDAFDL